MEDLTYVYEPIIQAIETVTGLSGKVYHAEALKNASPPFAFWEQTSEETEQALDGYTCLERAGFNIHLCARRLDTLSPMAAGIKAALIALQGTAVDGFLYERVDIRQISPEIVEKEVGLFRKVYQITVDYQQVTLCP